MESYGSGTLEETIEVEHLKQILLERLLREDAAGSYRSRALEEAMLERQLRSDAAGSYRSKALG